MPVAPPLGPDSGKIINLGEIGYGVDTRLAAKAAEKRLQHAALEADLCPRGWDVHVHPIALGVSGALQAVLPATLRELGIEGKSIGRVLSQLQNNAVFYCHSLHIQRRQLERACGAFMYSGGSYTGHGPPGPQGEG